MAIIVYVKPSCVQCASTYRGLDSKGIEYEVHDISQDPAALAEFKELGESQAPVVVTPWGYWSGFRPDMIDALEALLRREHEVNAAMGAFAQAIVAFKLLTEQRQAQPTRRNRGEATFTRPGGDPDEYPAPPPH